MVQKNRVYGKHRQRSTSTSTVPYTSFGMSYFRLCHCYSVFYTGYFMYFLTMGAAVQAGVGTRLLTVRYQPSKVRWETKPRLWCHLIFFKTNCPPPSSCPSLCVILGLRPAPPPNTPLPALSPPKHPLAGAHLLSLSLGSVPAHRQTRSHPHRRWCHVGGAHDTPHAPTHCVPTTSQNAAQGQ